MNEQRPNAHPSTDTLETVRCKSHCHQEEAHQGQNKPKLGYAWWQSQEEEMESNSEQQRDEVHGPAMHGSLVHHHHQCAQ
jgi:hypothetical protein